MNKSRYTIIFSTLFILSLLIFSSSNVFASSILYKVKSGDTLGIIASKYATTTTDITQINNLTSTSLYIGQVLTINTSPVYTVKSGDTLYLISLKYNTTVDDLVYYNNLTSTNIYIGQILRVAPPNPTVNLKSGTYVGVQTALVQNPVTGGAVYYTLDGKTPFNTSTLYSGIINIDKTSILKLVSTKNGNYSDVTQISYTVNYPPSPVSSSLESGTYVGGQTIGLTSATGEVFFTLDGTTPNNTSTKYTAPIQINKDSLISVVVFDASTGLYSSVKQFDFKIAKPASPTADILSGYFEDIINVNLFSSDNNTILFTTDGSDPALNGVVYSSSIRIDKNTTLRSATVKNGVYSLENTYNYEINLIPKAPVSNISDGLFNTVQTLNLTTGSSDSEIFFTLDGTAPTNSSSKFTSPITLSEPTTVKAVTINKYGFSSNITTLFYNILIKPEIPTIDMTSGVYYDIVKVSLSSTTADSSIFYTTDGTAPTTASNLYTGTLTLDKTTTLNAITVSKFGVPSDPVSRTYAISLIPEAPVFNISSGTYYDIQNINLTTTAPFAEIYFTLDGSEPTMTSTKFTSPVSISKTSTMKAKTFRNAYSSNTAAVSLKIYLKTFISHTVASSETLDSIAKKYYSTTSEIISLNNLTSTTLTIGQVLKVYNYKYTVLSGENLAIIAERSNTTVDNIIAANKMASDIIYVGQPIKLAPWGTNGITVSKGITIAKLAACSPSKLPPPSVTSRPEYNVTFATQREEDLYWLARIIYSEAQGEIYTGQLAVGNVVTNRSKSYGMRIKDVVFETVGGYIQFEPVINGSIFNNANTSTQNAALEAYNGVRPVGDCLYFQNPDTAQSSWISKNRTYYMTIGNHDFYL